MRELCPKRATLAQALAAATGTGAGLGRAWWPLMLHQARGVRVCEQGVTLQMELPSTQPPRVPWAHEDDGALSPEALYELGLTALGREGDVTEERRGYSVPCPACEGRGRGDTDPVRGVVGLLCGSCGDTGRTRASLAAPPTRQGVLALLSAWGLVLQAELLAQEFAARLAQALDQPQSEAPRVLWRVAPRGAFGHDLGFCLPELVARRMPSSVAVGAYADAILDDAGYQVYAAVQARAWASTWHRSGLPGAPFAPLLALWDTGMAFEGLGAEGELLLGCPDLSALQG